MAVPRTARVVGVQMLGEDTRLLDLLAVEPLGFIGGQYVIVDSGLVAPSGKAVKRAYSLLTSDAEQCRFQLAVKRIPDGPGSHFLHRLEVGTDVSFSGPWGKFFPRDGSSGTTLVVATDTGITAALGLLQGKRFEALLATTVFVWLRTSGHYFLPETFVRQRISAACAEARFETCPAVDQPERIPCARAALRDIASRTGVKRVFLAGDGAVNAALLEDLMAMGVPVARENVESFFNAPKKSA